MTDRPNPPASKRTRIAAAEMADSIGAVTERARVAIRNGEQDDHWSVQSFAQFERTLLDEIKARVRGLLVSEDGDDIHAAQAFNCGVSEALAAIASIQGRE